MNKTDYIIYIQSSQNKKGFLCLHSAVGLYPGENIANSDIISFDTLAECKDKVRQFKSLNLTPDFGSGWEHLTYSIIERNTQGKVIEAI